MDKTICVMGLGYIGLPTASMFATHGLQGDWLRGAGIKEGDHASIQEIRVRRRHNISRIGSCPAAWLHHNHPSGAAFWSRRFGIIPDDRHALRNRDTRRSNRHSSSDDQVG